MEIRPVEQDDWAAIRAVVTAAYGRRSEVDLLDRLAADGDLALCMVAFVNGRLVGQAALSFMVAPVDSLMLAPVAVTPGMQGLGIGSALIRAVMDRAWKEEAAALFAHGEPPFGARFGFSPFLAESYPSVMSGPFWLAQVRPGFAPESGSAQHASAFVAAGVTSP